MSCSHDFGVTMETVRADVLIVGSGIAGLYTALNLDPCLKVVFVTKESFNNSSSWLAQGGIAAAIDESDSPEQHFQDTLIAGAGICSNDAVRVLVDEGPADIEALNRMKVPFDLNSEGELAVTLEGGHTRHRVVHAGGDATGRETVKTLSRLCSQRENITFLDDSFFIDLIVQDQCVKGAYILKNRIFAIVAPFVVLCTGGIGQIFSNTTNPGIATGDGLGACIRADVALEHMEFIQFHPTGLYQKNEADCQSKRTFLISEAVRGEGGLLRNVNGERFMTGKHPMAELAPRDIVARAILAEMQATNQPHVWLDITEKPAQHLQTRFPTIYNECLNRGIDISKHYIPVAPVQHYMIGGIKTDLLAQTSMKNLFAVGEAASTGVHGANRLASNSMLECLVFGRRAAAQINELSATTKADFDVPELDNFTAENDTSAELAQVLKKRIRACCDSYINVVRTTEGLAKGSSEIEQLISEIDKAGKSGKALWEARNMAQTAQAVFRAAMLRKNSIGTHFKEE